jgi:hypothetical protein
MHIDATIIYISTNNISWACPLEVGASAANETPVIKSKKN